MSVLTSIVDIEVDIENWLIWIVYSQSEQGVLEDESWERVGPK